MSEYLLEMKGISKSFPGVKALQNVEFQLKAGDKIRVTLMAKEAIPDFIRPYWTESQANADTP